MTTSLNPHDPATIAIFKSLFASIPEEMGVVLGRTAHSPNIKERRDYSCALFDAGGEMVAQAAHIPVHLGAMPTAVQAAKLAGELGPGDMVILNDPYLGGTHLPDVSLVSAVFSGERLVGYVSNRAHHADIGGMSPGSMPVASELFQEGIIIPPVKLYDAGVRNEAVFQLILRNVRTPEERRGDFDAQIAAQRTGERRLLELVERYGLDEVHRQMMALKDYAERMTRAALAAIPSGVYEFEDALDDDGETEEPVPIRVRLTIGDGFMHCDFSGSAPQRPSSINAVAAVTRSAVYYVVRCLLDEDVPANEGCFRPVSFTLPEGSVVNARPPMAVSAGNVETSQRITDVMLGALAQALLKRIPAASAGTMNNLTIGGYDPRRDRYYSYYETIGGGAGASPDSDGLSAVQLHMTNTLNTPIEALELAYPFLVRQYSIRDGSGGSGRHHGGDGIVREYEFLAPATVTIVSERRRRAPWGLAGGGDAQPGRNRHMRADGVTVALPGKVQLRVQPGDRLVIETPGGGGWGQGGRVEHW